MTDTNVFQLSQPATFADPLTEVLRRVREHYRRKLSSQRSRPCSVGTPARPQTRGQRCWMHKTANVLNKLPKRFQAGRFWSTRNPRHRGMRECRWGQPRRST
jgi:hypothetical protein